MIDDQNLTDEQIVKIIQKGNVEAFEILVNRLQEKLLRYIKRLVFDNNDAEDILQNVFIKAYQNIMGFNFDYKFSSWIYRIAHNESVNYLRLLNKRPIFNIEWDILFPINVSKNEIGEEIDKESLSKWIQDNLKNIDKKYQEVLSLYYLEDMSYKDISDVLQIPIATVGVRIKRAKNIMKNNYNKQIKK